MKEAMDERIHYIQKGSKKKFPNRLYFVSKIKHDFEKDAYSEIDLSKKEPRYNNLQDAVNRAKVLNKMYELGYKEIVIEDEIIKGESL